MADNVRESLKEEYQDAAGVVWKSIGEYKEIRFEKWNGIAKITICRPHKHNAFTPLTVDEMLFALKDARFDEDVRSVIFAGEGDKAFCSGGDQGVRGQHGYKDASGMQRLNVLDLQREIRALAKPVLAMVAGYAIGGGHVLHMVCDITVAAENAVFGQTGPKVGSFDGGFGASYMARIVGQKKAREIWFLSKQYGASEALEMGLVNAVVPTKNLQRHAIAWCLRMNKHSHIALRMLKASLNADCDGQAGLQQLAGNATMLYYMSEEAQEGRNAYNQKRKPNFGKFPPAP